MVSFCEDFGSAPQGEPFAACSLKEGNKEVRLQKRIRILRLPSAPDVRPTAPAPPIGRARVEGETQMNRGEHKDMPWLVGAMALAFIVIVLGVLMNMH